MGRPTIGKRTTSSSSGLHSYFLRSASGTQALGLESHDSVASSPTCSSRSDSPNAARTLKKKSSIWSMFSRGSRKVSNSAGPARREPLSMSNVSTMNIDIPGTTKASATLFDMMSMPEHSLDELNSSLEVPSISHRALRSQKSMHTFHSTQSAPILRNAKSQFSLRIPSGVPRFDTDSIFSDDSEGDVSVSWVTSKGLRKVGLDIDDDCDMIDIRR